MNTQKPMPPRPGQGGPNQQRDTHRINHQIRFPQIRLIGPDGAQIGIVSPEEGREIAEQHGLDLVEVEPHARPPVCKVMDYGKYKYEESKKSKSRGVRVEIKTITLRPKTDTHDLQTKLSHARKFLLGGDRVKFVMRMRGREQAHIDMWEVKMGEIVSALADISSVVAPPRLEGRTITAMVEPQNTRSGSGGGNAPAASGGAPKA